MDGYFSTRGGKVLNPDTPVGLLGLKPEHEVVFQCRLREGDSRAVGKVLVAGGNRRGIFGQPRRWNTRYSCYRCGFPRYLEGGGGCQGGQGSGEQGNEPGKRGMYQGGVGTGMGGIRVYGSNGRDQTYVSGSDPTHRKKPQGGNGNKNKAVRVPGGGIGTFGVNAWLDGGGGRVRGGGEGNRTPLPVGEVMSDRDKALEAMVLLKELLGEDIGNSMEELVREHLPPAEAPVPHPSPTEHQQDRLEKGVQEGRERVEGG